MDKLLKIRESFWGLKESTVSPNPTQRSAKLLEWFKNAIFYKNTEVLIFPCEESSEKYVCESGLYHILGYQNTEGYVTQWRSNKSERLFQLNPEKYSKPTEPEHNLTKLRFPTAKEKTKAYIKLTASKIAESVPDKIVKRDDVMIVPFLNSAEFYHLKYVPDMMDLGEDPVSLDWFKEAFNEVPNVRTLRCRGSFNTCGICNKADDLANDRKRFSRPQQIIFEKYKQNHLIQQYKERQTLEENIQLAQSYDQYGNTQHALLYSDGMTVMTGNTPRSKGSENPYITNRVIGVMAVCGHINQIFIYNLDDFVAGGANTMIEIMRQGILLKL
jgi:hypothetical protein